MFKVCLSNCIVYQRRFFSNSFGMKIMNSRAKLKSLKNVKSSFSRLPEIMEGMQVQWNIGLDEKQYLS